VGTQSGGVSFKSINASFLLNLMESKKSNAGHGNSAKGDKDCKSLT
jgi:hypothetical protein